MSELSGVDGAGLSERVHDYFISVKRSKSAYDGFIEVPFDPFLHDFSETTLRCHENSNMTRLMLDAGATTLASNFYESVVPDMQRVWEEYDIAAQLTHQSFILASPHFNFADQPLEAAAWIEQALRSKVYSTEAEAASHVYMVVSRFVDTLGTQLTTMNGTSSLSENGLRHISTLLRTLPDSKSGKAHGIVTPKQRSEHANAVKHGVLSAARGIGNVILMAAGGEHDEIIGDTLNMKRVRKGTAELIVKAEAQVIYCITKCTPTYEKGGKIVADPDAFIKSVGTNLPKTADDIHKYYEKMADEAPSLLTAHGLPISRATYKY